MKRFLLLLFRFLFQYQQSKTSPYLSTSADTATHKHKTATLVPVQTSPSISTASFFIVAHPDDIELFMGAKARHEVAASTPNQHKKIFIVLIAGDANRKNRVKPLRRISWWQAREQAHTVAISFWNKYRQQPTEHQVMINQRSITKINLGADITLYNFRLPDADKHTSLYQLVQQQTSSITDLLDQIYSLQDLQQSLAELINLECEQAGQADFYITDCDPERNPGDHKDHCATSLLVLDVMPKINIANKQVYGYLTYSIKDQPVNLTGEDKTQSFATWALMGEVLDYHGYKKNDDAYHMQWVGKQYQSFCIQPEMDLAEMRNLNKLRTGDHESAIVGIKKSKA